MMKFKAIFSFSIFSLSFLSLIVSVSAASLPSPSLTVPASLQVGTKAIIPFTFSSNIFADVLSPQHPGLQFLLCKASETTPALCVQGARSDALNSLSRPAPFFEGSAARDKGSAGSFELDLMRVVPGTYNLYVFAVWWPTSSKGIVAGRYDTYKSPSFEVGALIETSRFLPSPSLTVPASLQVGTKAIIPFTFSSNIFADVLSPQHPGLQFLLCKASETTPALCVQGARSDARNSLSRPAPFFEGSAARDKGSAGSFELDLMRVVPGTYNLYVFAVWWPTSSKGIVAGRYDTYKSPSFEVGARPEVEVVSPISGVIFQPETN